MVPFNYGVPMLNPLTESMHVIKVSGRSGVDSFNMPPNSDVLLLDTSAPIIWFVQTDANGTKSAVPYDISEHKEVKPEDTLKVLEERIARLEEKINVKSNNGNSKQWKPEQHNDAGSGSNVKG